VDERAARVMKVRRPEEDEQPNVRIRALEPDDDAERSHRATSLRSNDVPRPPDRSLPPNRQGISKVRVHRDQSTAALLGRMITQLYTSTDLTVCVEHHVACQTRDFAGAL
jgi:hypothetical protein